MSQNISKAFKVWCVLLMCLVGPTLGANGSNLRKQHMLRAFRKNPSISLLGATGLQVESEGQFDIVEQPEQFLEENLQIVSFKIKILKYWFSKI